MKLWEAKVDPEWCKRQLLLLQNGLAQDRDVEGRLKEFKEQCNAWASVGDPVLVARTLEQGLASSFGISYRKDNQLARWMDWLPC